MLRLSGGLMVTVDGADAARLPARVAINGTLGRAITGGSEVMIRRHDGRHDTWPRPDSTSMDHAMSEIVSALDAGTATPYPPTIPLRVFEAIVGFHLSDELNGAWVELPIGDVDRTREIRIG